MTIDPIIFCIVLVAAMFGFLYLMRKLEQRGAKAVRLMNQSTMIICPKCETEVSKRKLVSDYGQCVYCVLEAHNFIEVRDKDLTVVKTAIPKPKE